MVYLFVFYCLIFCPFHIRSLDRGDDTPIYTRDLDRDPVESRLRGKISDVGNYQRISFRLRFRFGQRGRGIPCPFISWVSLHPAVRSTGASSASNREQRLIFRCGMILVIIGVGLSWLSEAAVRADFGQPGSVRCRFRE